jgi:hypothetical protein
MFAEAIDNQIDPFHNWETEWIGCFEADLQEQTEILNDAMIIFFTTPHDPGGKAVMDVCVKIGASALMIWSMLNAETRKNRNGHRQGA